MLKHCCRKLPLTDLFRVGSGAGLAPASALHKQPLLHAEHTEDVAASEATDADNSIPIIVVPVMQQRRTASYLAEQLLASIVKSARSICGLESWRKYSYAVPMMVMSMICAFAFLYCDGHVPLRLDPPLGPFRSMSILLSTENSFDRPSMNMSNIST